MYPSVKKVVASEDHVLLIDFDNGEYGTLDMKPFLDFGVFQALKNQNAFKQVQVSFDTVSWASGVDLDPEFVYEKCLLSEGIRNSDQTDETRKRA